MDVAFGNLTGRSAALARLHAVLSSPKRAGYILGIEVLYHLFSTERWILKEHFLEQLSERFENSVFDFSRDEDELLDRWMTESEDDEAEPDEPAASKARLSARTVYHRLGRAGWFFVCKDEVNGALCDTLVVPHEASSLARFVALTEAPFERGASRGAESPCVYPTFTTIKMATDEYLDASAPQKGHGTRPIERPAVREAVAKKLYNSLMFAEERSKTLNDRLREALHGFKILSDRISRATGMAELGKLVEVDYRKALFESVMQPLRLEDGFDHYGARVVGILDSWLMDDDVMELIAEGSRLAGGERSTVSLKTDIYLLRYDFGLTLKEVWDYVTSLETGVAELVARRYRILLGGHTSTETGLSRCLMRLCSDNPRVCEIAVEALHAVFPVPFEDSFYDEDFYRVRSRREARPDRTVTITESSMVKKSARMPTARENGIKAAVAKMNAMIEKRGGLVTNDDLALAGRDDRAFQMVCVLAGNGKDADYVVREIDDTLRIRSGSQNVPFVTFEAKAGRCDEDGR